MLFPLSVFCEGAIECVRLIQPNRGNSIETLNFDVFSYTKRKYYWSFFNHSVYPPQTCVGNRRTRSLHTKVSKSGLYDLCTLSPPGSLWSSVSWALGRWQVTRPASHIRISSDPVTHQIIVHNEQKLWQTCLQITVVKNLCNRLDSNPFQTMRLCGWKFSKKKKIVWIN